MAIWKGDVVMNVDEVKQWLMKRLPLVIVDCELHVTNDDELIVLLQLDTSMLHGDGQERVRAEQRRIAHFRVETRETRVQLGRELSQQYGYDVSWGMRAGETTQYFTSNMKPVMTRLSAEERQVVDTLIAANIVHTRSAALSYIVRVFATEHQDWLTELRQALVHIEQVRDQFQPQQHRGMPALSEKQADDAVSTGNE